MKKKIIARLLLAALGHGCLVLTYVAHGWIGLAIVFGVVTLVVAFIWAVINA